MPTIVHYFVSNEYVNENALMPVQTQNCGLLSQACEQSNTVPFFCALGKLFCLNIVKKDYSGTGMCLTGLALSASVAPYLS